MQLTTPKPKEYDPVFPGENWFFYWKTSPALWESKIIEQNIQGPLLIPVNWGFHAQNIDKFDFGSYRPETDLARLIQICQKLRFEPILVMPISPMPFLPNAGVPPHLAHYMSVDKNGLAVAIMDNDERINKVYSYFSPELFKGYKLFVEAFAHYMQKMGISCEIFGADFGHVTKEGYTSFIEDHSQCFDKGFNRYIKQLQLASPELMAQKLANPAQEKLLRTEYTFAIANLYRELVKETLGAYWAGEFKVALLGGMPNDVHLRVNDNPDIIASCFQNFFDIIANGATPSCVLMTPKYRQSVLTKIVGDYVNKDYLAHHLKNSNYVEATGQEFTPLVFFEIVKGDLHYWDQYKMFYENGLGQFLGRQYHATYRIVDMHEENEEEEEFFYRKVFFFNGKTLDKHSFNGMLTLFLAGGKIFLDTSSIAEVLMNKINLFILENNLKIEKVNFMTDTTKIQLGDGVWIMYDGEKLTENPPIKKVKFWENMLAYLKIKHLNIEADDDVYYFWTTRVSSAYELNYQEIRRVHFYNPSSYKRKIQVRAAGNFAFLKSIDPMRAEIKSTPIGVQVELLPSGSVSLDFGHYE